MYRFIRSVRKVYTHSLHILVTVGIKINNILYSELVSYKSDVERRIKVVRL